MTTRWSGEMLPGTQNDPGTRHEVVGCELLAEKVRIVESKVKSGAANPAPKLANLIASPELSVSRFGVVPTVTRLRKLPKCTETGQLSAREISRAPGAFGN